MKTLLVPVDFTATTENAVDFAIKWSKRYEYKRIILLKTFYDSMFENLIISAEYSHVNQDYLNQLRQEGEDQLQELCKKTEAKVDADIKVSTAVSEVPLLRSIFETIESEQPELIVLGSNNYSSPNNSFVASNVISIAKASPIRVLVVPADYTYKPVEQALVPYKSNMLNDLSKLTTWKSQPYWDNMKLVVLNIDAESAEVKTTQKVKDAEDKLQNLLKNFKFEVFYASNKNVINAISDFTKEHNVQLIIAMPGKYSFLYNLTHQNISEAICKHAKQPVLILK